MQRRPRKPRNHLSPDDIPGQAAETEAALRRRSDLPAGRIQLADGCIEAYHANRDVSLRVSANADLR